MYCSQKQFPEFEVTFELYGDRSFDQDDQLFTNGKYLRFIVVDLEVGESRIEVQSRH